jgi:hypothetical protein
MTPHPNYHHFDHALRAHGSECHGSPLLAVFFAIWGVQIPPPQVNCNWNNYMSRFMKAMERLRGIIYILLGTSLEARMVGRRRSLWTLRSAMQRLLDSAQNTSRQSWLAGLQPSHSRLQRRYRSTGKHFKSFYISSPFTIHDADEEFQKSQTSHQERYILPRCLCRVNYVPSLCRYCHDMPAQYREGNSILLSLDTREVPTRVLTYHGGALLCTCYRCETSFPTRQQIYTCRFL